jgi:hypothetical protein
MAIKMHGVVGSFQVEASVEFALVRLGQHQYREPERGGNVMAWTKPTPGMHA